MFAEVEFDDENDETSLNTGVLRGPTASDVTMRFHQPGEEAFSAVAGSHHDTAAIYDPRSISGDSWVGQDCHCTRCEGLRVVQKLAAFEDSRSRRLRGRMQTAPFLLVLLDLDNFGFNQFKSVSPYLPDDVEDAPLIENVFFWCLFGSCFTRYHKVWPSEETVVLPFSAGSANDRVNGKTATSAKKTPPRLADVEPIYKKKSVWQQLVDGGQVHFTPCSGNKQAADNVIIDVVRSFSPMYRMTLVTGDVELIRMLKPRHRHIGRKSGRADNENQLMADRLDTVNADACGKRFLPVWQELALSYRRMVDAALQDPEEG